MRFQLPAVLSLTVLLTACGGSDPKPAPEPPKAPEKLGSNPVAAPLDYIAAIGKARKATLGRLDQAKLIDAIQKFEASEGRAPKDLSELVPNFIPSIPPAPAGMKLEYQPADASFMLVPIAPPPAPAEKK